MRTSIRYSEPGSTVGLHSGLHVIMNLAEDLATVITVRKAVISATSNQKLQTHCPCKSCSS